MDLVFTHGDLDAVPDQSAATRKPGARNDLSECKRKLDEGAEPWDLADDHWGTTVRYHKAFQAYKHHKTGERSWKTRVMVFYGAPGTGKSRAAFEFPDAFVVPASNGTQWMDGYVPGRHRVVIFDDFHASVPAHVLLRLLDEYPMQYPTKGGFVQFKPAAVILTSNYHPREWYDWNNIKADFDAFERRVDVQWCYFKPETPADKAWCEENNAHCLIKSEKGDWHPHRGSFIEHPADGVMGVPRDAEPATVDLDAEWALYETLLEARVDEPEAAPSPEPEVVELSSDSDSQSSSSSN